MVTTNRKKQVQIKEEGGQFVGVFGLEDAPTSFLRRLIELAIEDGESWGVDAEGCKVSAILLNVEEQ